MKATNRATATVIILLLGLMVPYGAVDAAVPAGTHLIASPIPLPAPPGDAQPQAASVAGTADGASVVYYAGTEVETWTYAAASNTWTKRTPSEQPSQRQGAAAAPLANATSHTLLYGGFQEVGEVYFDQTWMFDATTGEWTQRCGPCAPHGLARSMMAASPTQTLLVGGSTEFGFNNLVWRWNDQASDWDAISPATPGGAPPPRGDAMFAFDGTDFVLYGGLNGSFVSMDDAWLLVDEGAGAFRWEPLCASCPPGPRALAAFSQLGGAGTPSGALLFGGQNIDSHQPTTPTYSDGWFLDGTDHTWTKVIAGIAPTPDTENPAVPYGPTLGTFGSTGQAKKLVLTDTRFDSTGNSSSESQVLAWQLPPPTTTTTTVTPTSTSSPTSTSASTAPTSITAVVVTPRFAG